MSVCKWIKQAVRKTVPLRFAGSNPVRHTNMAPSTNWSKSPRFHRDTCCFSQRLNVGTGFLNIDSRNVHFLAAFLYCRQQKSCLPKSRQAAMTCSYRLEDAPHLYMVCFCLSRSMRNKTAFKGHELRIFVTILIRHDINSVAQHFRVSPFVSF